MNLSKLIKAGPMVVFILSQGQVFFNVVNVEKKTYNTDET